MLIATKKYIISTNTITHIERFTKYQGIPCYHSGDELEDGEQGTVFWFGVTEITGDTGDSTQASLIIADRNGGKDLWDDIG
ncbi:hypothetical protein LCGC14_1918860, partial [marine sediment metagenome]